MSLNSLLRWLKPHELVFFDLLEASASNLHAVADLFSTSVREGNISSWNELRQEMKNLERKGDEITHEILDKLNQTFVTPIEREDILSLAHALDDAVDCIYATSERFVLFKIDSVPPIAKELVSILPAGSQKLVELIHHLRNMQKVKEIRECIRAVNDMEHQADALYHAALADLFDNPSDPVYLMKWREILGLMEDATDLIELVAKMVGSTVMKNA